MNISETEHQWEFSWQGDGGYFGDGKISGYFGPDPKPGNSTGTGGTGTTGSTETPINPAVDDPSGMI